MTYMHKPIQVTPTLKWSDYPSPSNFYCGEYECGHMPLIKV